MGEEVEEEKEEQTKEQRAVQSLCSKERDCVKSIHHTKALNKFDHNVGCPETGRYRSAGVAVASITRSVGRE